ncbi:MAG TPA: hypothetical protein VFR67_19440, partial [Pilimelia sp.]|nr:hypothetical protein [Pilimelia sp.]
MNRLLEPPRERDLPFALRAQMRGRVLEAIEVPPPRRRKAWRLAIGPVAVAAAVLVVASPALVDRHGNGDRPDVVAFGAGAVSPGLRRVIAECERSAYG